MLRLRIIFSASRKELIQKILFLIMSSESKPNSFKSTKLVDIPLFKMHLKASMALFLPMDKLALVRLSQWSATTKIQNIKVLSLVGLIML